MLNNETLELDLCILAASILEAEVVSDLQIVNGLYQKLVSKLANTRINDFMNATMEREKKVLNANEMLRLCLKTYALETNR